MNKIRAPWGYKGIFVQPADFNSSGIRWMARTPWGPTLRADSKAGMRELVTNIMTANGLISIGKRRGHGQQR